MNIRSVLNARLQAALRQCGIESSPLLRSASRPEFGDYQANGVMAAAKALGQNPRELALKVQEVLLAEEATSPERVIAKAEVAGPGFINLFLEERWLAAQVVRAPLIEAVAVPQTVVVDYSSPNLAKEMHVGHLRSTIIGDAVARMLEALGNQVIRQNHVGDWGTQFGMLITELAEQQAAGQGDFELHDLEAFYQQAKAHFDADPGFAERARAAVVKLQQGDAAVRTQWAQFVELSLAHTQSQYERLGVSLSVADVMPESAYNDALPEIVARLDAKGLLTESDGAQCVFLDEFKKKKGEPLPVIVQKSGGGYLYATTDLAAAEHRSKTLKADRVLYLVDVRQSLHFKQVFAVARAAGFVREETAFEHLPFGTMLGKDGKPFKTRAGGVIKLKDLLDEAEARAGALLAARGEISNRLSREEQIEAQSVIGIGAVKYSDLSKNRTSDYVFDWDQMIAFEGDTAPYLQYAYTRVRSLFRKAEVPFGSLAAADPIPSVSIAEAAERALVLTLLQLQEVLESASNEGFPHYLTGYLYELATRYSQFYEQCPVLKAPDDLREGRLLLCQRTGQTLELGLELLGIGTVERM